jgi:aerobic-type carbon monoxide dehydrogenase small subunit (CoxS/CutS family)
MKKSESVKPGSFHRRTFLKSLGTTTVAAAASQAQAVAAELANVNAEKVVGPGAAPITLQVNAQTLKLQLEPRVTLLDALRDHAGFTGAKEGCDHGACGACTVLVDNLPVYACMMLAIEAQGRAITTIEGLALNGKLSKVQQAFLVKDALLCGYCTPGFVMSVTGLLRKTPQPTAADVKHACAGNLCRCGAQPRIIEAAMQAAGVAPTSNSKTEVIRYA